ncbi:MAG: hypothetical protein GX193_01135 [Clostridiales bacterium]|nr:hypothetical protein [Clostridiales bacterium]
MSEKRVHGKEIPVNNGIDHKSLTKSTEQTVCAPEFPKGCIDLDDDEKE